MAAYYVLKFISKIICLLPWSVAVGLGNILGALALKITPAWRLKMAAANVEECLGLGPEASKKIAEQSLTKFGRMII